jgi:hypothetical protein
MDASFGCVVALLIIVLKRGQKPFTEFVEMTNF